jgi:hypothetical protein
MEIEATGASRTRTVLLSYMRPGYTDFNSVVKPNPVVGTPIYSLLGSGAHGTQAETNAVDTSQKRRKEEARM